jgi:hypothetical protein
MNEDGREKLHSFLMLSGREFAAGNAEWDGERVVIGHYVHIAGKDFDDAHKELRDHLEKNRPVDAQITMPVCFAPLGDVASPIDMLSKFSHTLGLAPNNVHVIFINATTGLPLKKGEFREGAIAMGFSKTELITYRSMLATLGVPNAAISIRIANAIGALRSSMAACQAPNQVICVSIMPAFTQLYVVTPAGVDDLGIVDHGYKAVLAQIMSALELKFEGSAARLFFGNIYDFSEMGEFLAKPLATQVRAKLAEYAGEKPLALMISGLPPMRTRMFAKYVSAELGIDELNLPIIVDSPKGGLPAMPAVGAPSAAHMLLSSSGINKESAFYLDLSNLPLEALDYWWDETVPDYGHKYLRRYRGNIVGDYENTSDKKSTLVEKEKFLKPPVPTETPKTPRKVVRLYRGSPIYEE